MRLSLHAHYSATNFRGFWSTSWGLVVANASAPESNQESRRNDLSLTVLAYACLSRRVSSAAGASLGALCVVGWGCAGDWAGSFALSSNAEQEGRGCSTLGSWPWHSARTPVPFFIEVRLFPSWCTSEASALKQFLPGFPGDRPFPVRSERSLGVILAHQAAWEEQLVLAISSPLL